MTFGSEGSPGKFCDVGVDSHFFRVFWHKKHNPRFFTISKGLIKMYFCGNYVYSYGPNWEDFNIISIFGVICGQNLVFAP